MFDKLLDFLLGDLYSNSEKQREPLRKRYARIIQRLSNDGRATIFKETKSVVAWGVANMGGKTVFRIIDDGCNIDLSYLSESPFFGKMEKKWSFPSNMNQDEIVDWINSDIQKLFTNGR